MERVAQASLAGVDLVAVGIRLPINGEADAVDWRPPGRATKSGREVLAATTAGNLRRACRLPWGHASSAGVTARGACMKATFVVVAAVLVVLVVAAIFPGAFGWVHFTGLSMRR